MLRRLRSALSWRNAEVTSTEVPSPAMAPDGTIIYAVGDIHGELELLLEMLAAIKRDFADHGPETRAIVIFIGDYIDRGGDSAGVIDCLLGDPLPGFKQHWLLGNHEAAMLDFMDMPAEAVGWLDFGGTATLHSYGVNPMIRGSAPDRARTLRDKLAAQLPSTHLAFLNGLELSVVYDDYAFVHAGVRPGRPLADQGPEDLLWIRSPFLESQRRHEKVIVHGHTIVPDVQILPNRIAIDTGAYSSGRLSAIALQGAEVRVLQVHRSQASRRGVPALAALP
jgi:serine/threonine protein phosphatase 1